eukprot:maker-scaffold1133_size60293-snap-gene-0.6 protein:Tk07730 transcript:maker-scaffold1133_size60293-snap-gene-0.6-mRNA-1 annotation:"upf0462 protein c4orf33-like protein"
MGNPKQVQVMKQWDGKDITDHDPKISATFEETNDGLRIQFSAPFFDDPKPSESKAGEAFYQLWDFEVVEFFFLARDGTDNHYLELEFGPHGQHLALLLTGDKTCLEHSLPLEYTSEIERDSMTWTGLVFVPYAYFPPGVTHFNVYGIHASGPKVPPGSRVYEALFPVPGDGPNFHRTNHFGPWPSSRVLSDLSRPLSNVWLKALSNK